MAIASNTTLNTGAGGDVIATKERTHDGDATKVQVVTLAGVSGSEGSYTYGDINGDTTNGLDVDVTRVGGGGVAHDASATSQNPLTIGGYASAAAPSDVSADGDAVRAWLLRNGAQATVVTAAGALIGGDATNGLDVDVTRVGGNVTVVGPAAEDAAASGNPVLTGGRYDSSPRTLETGDVGAIALNASGQVLVEIAAGAGSGGTAAADDADFTAGTTSATPIMGAYQSSPTNVTDGDMGIVGITQNRAMRVAIDSGGVAGATHDAVAATEGLMQVGYASSSLPSAVASGDNARAYYDLNGRQVIIPGGGVVSSANSTTANLAGAAAFTGTSEEVKDYAAILVSVYSSHASGTNGLSLQQSSDGTNWDITDTFTVSATAAMIIHVQPAARYFRLVYTNGATLTTSLRIMTVFHYIAPKPSSQRPADAMSNENDFEQSLSYLMGYNGTTWDRLRTTGTGILNVVLTASTATQEIVGDAATDAAVSGNPVYIAGRGNSGTPTAMSANNDVTPLWLTLNGATVVAGEIVDDAAFTPGTSRVHPVGFTADETATDSVDEGDVGAARMTLDRKQIATVYGHAAAGGCTPYKNLDVDETEDDIKTSAGKLFWLHVMNLASSTRYLKVYDNVAASVTVGTTTPVLTYPIPANTMGFTIGFGPQGTQFTTGICIAATTGLADNDTGAPGANEVVVNAGYL